MYKSYQWEPTVMHASWCVLRRFVKIAEKLDIFDSKKKKVWSKEKEENKKVITNCCVISQNMEWLHDKLLDRIQFDKVQSYLYREK